VNLGKIPEDPKIRLDQTTNQENTSLREQINKESQLEEKQLSSLSNFFKLPPKKIVKQINRLLKSDQLEAQKLLEFAKINISNKQQIALSAFSCLLDLCKISLTKEEEEEIFKAIEEEQDEDMEDQQNPEKRKKREARRKRNLKQRMSDPKKYKTNLLLGLLNKSIEILEKKVRFDLKA